MKLYHIVRVLRHARPHVVAVTGLAGVFAAVFAAALAAVLAAVLAGCGRRDATVRSASSDAAVPSHSADSAVALSVVPAIIPSAFTVINGEKTLDARRGFDLTGDGRPETITIHVHGPLADSADVILSIQSTNGDTLYATAWNTRLYFIYTPRKGMTADSADEVVVSLLRRVLEDSAFVADGLPARMRQAAIPSGGKETSGIDRDAIRYDLKENAVRVSHALPRTAPLRGAMLDEMQNAAVRDAAIDSLASELKGMSTFTYFAGGEVTNTIAWSRAKHRFVRVFSCC